ncbi:porin [Methylobacterium aquaticum]|uniref:Porin n=2 Tax=Methylobacterium TaxID=407 RepID=A0A0C6FI45_9HYPH|nr:porin [Methylobacterium aquaticum]
MAGGGSTMRFAILGILAGLGLGAPLAAQAADLDFGVLRGGDYDPVAAPSPTVWDGIYVGGHGGWSSASFGFGSVFQPIVADALRATRVEKELGASTLLHAGDVRRDGVSFGAYAGVNYQFDDTVFGIELDYTHFGIAGRAPQDAIARSTVGSDGYYRVASLIGDSSTQINDYATIRARAGYALGNLMPYVTGGLAIGRAQVTDRVSIQNYEFDQATYRSNQALTDTSLRVPVDNVGYAPGKFNQSNPNFNPYNPRASELDAPRVIARTKEKIVGGFAAGAGLEYAITPGLILRAEYQYVLFSDFDGHKSNINTVRGGAAVKF